MSLKDEITQNAKSAFSDVWTTSDGRVVPGTADIGLGNNGRYLDATVLYADLADSTGLVRSHLDKFAAEVYSTYLYAASKIIRAHGGSITAFDGDRVMGVFVGDLKNSNAATCALRINHAVRKILQAELQKVYKTSTFKISQKVGIDTSRLLVARAGIRGSNDLVWIGNAANNAAKMAALDLGYATYISEATYTRLSDSARISSASSGSKNMWTSLGSSALGYPIYGSNWTWAIS